MADESKAEERNQGSTKSKRRAGISMPRYRQPISSPLSGSVGLKKVTKLSLYDPEEDELSARIDRALENIELIRRRMANDQIEIDKLRIETQAMIAELLT